MNDRRKTTDELTEELTALRREVAEWRARAQRAEALLEAAPLGIHACDTEGRITYVNPAQEAATGYTAEELLGTRVWERTVPGPEKDAIPPYFQRLVAEQPRPTPYATQNIRKNGEVFDIRVDWNYLRNADGKLAGFVSFVSDVTAHNRTEAARREIEERYRTLAEATVDIVYVVDREGVLLYANQSAAAQIGIDAAALVGKRQQELFPPEVAQQHLERLARVFETGQMGENDEVFHFGPHEVWLNIRSIPLRDEQGRVTAVMGVCRDVTERKRAEEALRAERNRAQQYLDVAAVMMVALDNAGNITLLNRRGCEILGYKEGELIGKNWFHTCVPQRVRADVLATFRELMAGRLEPIEYHENPVVTRAGEERTIAWHNALLTDAEGQVAGTLSSGIDVTEQKRAERLLRESEIKYRRLHETMRDAFVSVTMDGYIRECNEAYRQMLGYEDRELSALRYIDVTPEKWHAFEAEIVETQIVPRGYSDIYEKEYRRKDGAVFPVELRTILVRDDCGRPAGMWAIVRDITQRKRILAELQEAHDELERRVEERTAALSAANAELSREVQRRTQAQQALESSEARYRSVVEDQTETICRFAADGTFLFVNDVFCRFFGKTSEELLGRKWQPVAVAEDLPMIEERLRSLSLLNPVVTIENRVYCGRGEVRWMQFVNRGFFDREGRLVEVQAVGRDVTQRKLAEEALAESETKYRHLIETTDTGYLILDGEGRVVEANAEYVRLTGRGSLDEIRGRTVLEWTAPYDLERNAREVAKCLETGSVRQLEIDYIGPDGRVVPIDVNASVIETKWGRRVLALCRDITERKAAQEALRHNRDELQAVYDGMRDGLLIADIETKRFTRANGAICRMLGYSEEQVLSLSVADIHPREDLPAVLEAFHAQAEGRLALARELPVLRADGGVFYADIATNRIAYNGRDCLMGLFCDVTDRRKAEEAVRRHHRTLELMLQASDHERQTIAYDIHDGLAQQLAGAIMQFQIYDYAKDANPEQAAKAYRGGVALLQQGHAEARRIISGVRPPILDESGVVAAIAHLVHDPSVAHGPKVEFYSKAQFGRLPSIFENAIYRIAQEGLANACKHSQSPKVRISLVERGDRVRIEIRDWGIGFNPRKVKKNRFGLPGIRQRARLLGGKCRIRSAPGEGTTVAVDLPLPEERTDDE